MTEMACYRLKTQVKTHFVSCLSIHGISYYCKLSSWLQFLFQKKKKVN